MDRTDITEAIVHGYLSKNRGTRYRADHLADSFGVSYASLRMTLEGMVNQGRIKKAAYGKKARYYIPSAEEQVVVPLPIQPHWKREWTPDPEFLRRAEEAQAHRKQFPSKHV